MARSVWESVVSKVPWAKMLSTVDRPVPRPTWEAPPEPLTELASRSENTVRLDLNPTVLVLAILLPMTDMAVPLVFMPLMPL